MHDLKERLRAGETVVGPLVTIGSTEVAEMLAMVGFDYLWIETEHAPTDFVLAQRMIQAAGGRCPCLVRIPEAKEVWVKKALDMGCDGIVVPQVKTAEEARLVVEWSLYPPQGRRSVGISRAHDYGMSFQAYVRTANERLVIVLQVEHAESVKNIASILEVPGIDVIFVGPFDLSGSLGVLGQIDHPRVQAAIQEVKTQCERAGMPTGIFCLDARAARAAAEQAYNLIALGTDAGFLSTSARAALDRVKGKRDGG
ncbi:MAG: hypothetical protein JXA89_00035 [Anaerolineae bacterium]|nr:hypothetical protein [Anaerolineae bacterium]